MHTTTYSYSPEALAEMEMEHQDEKFLDPDEVELLYVDEADDTGEDRILYGWGKVCPIARLDGVNTCKSFTRHNCCESVVSESMARNYLAKHLFESTHHPSYGDKKASFEAANEEPIVCTVETIADRHSIRNKVAEYFAWGRNMPALAKYKRNHDRDRDRDRRRSRSRSARGNAARGSKGSGKQKKGESGVSAGPMIGAALPASSSSRPTTDDTAIASVRVPLGFIDELQTLEACLGRAIDSQKRTTESLNFFSRMIQDERHVFTEARNVLNELIFKANMGRFV